MVLADWVWLVALLPLAAFLLITLGGRRLRRPDVVAGVAMAVAFLVSLGVLRGVALGAAPEWHAVWATFGQTTVGLGYRIDALSSVMLAIITFVSLMVQIYSMGYMHGDARYRRYYGVLSLFSAAMIALVMADDLLGLFIAWELVGLCSYLLIGHWYEQAEVRYAAIKAFIVTRIGDVALLLGLFVVFAATGSLSFAAIHAAVASGAIAGPVITAAALLIFGGAVGKSAQFPLHVWLPDAMAGPTPVSALIHAATMVAAGVYLVARAYDLFAPSPEALATLAWIGGFTAIFAASMGLVMRDIKRVLAYSTVSQLGYMMLALGVGGYSAGLFHLTTHAFFKALLFLCAGSVIHAVETQDLFKMGGLAKRMPLTTVAWCIGAAALIGIPPFSGFFSKDAILAAAYHSPYTVPFWFGLIGIGFTAFYATRATLLAFFTPARATEVVQKAHDPGWVMSGPVLLLAIPAAFAGILNTRWTGEAFSHFVHYGPFAPENAPAALSWGITAIWLIGLLTAVALYRRPSLAPEPRNAAVRVVWRLLSERYYLSRAYDGIAFAFAETAQGLKAFDRGIIEGSGTGIARLSVWSGRVLRLAQTGRAQNYAMVVAVGVVVLLLVYGVFETPGA